MTQDMHRIAVVRTPAETAAVAALLREYAASLDVDLTYQGFDAELAALPGAYAPPSGELLLAQAVDGTPLGCVALRGLASPGCCEMKRLYVSPLARGIGLGRSLVEAVVDAASRLGYVEIRLDTLPTMHSAIALYRDVGFTTMPPYYSPSPDGTLFLRRALT